MSPTTDNFIHSLVEMSKAFEELPNVRHQASELERQNTELAQSVQQREESILRLKAELEASHEARRKVEAERDDAEMRFLELDEKAHKVLGDFEAIAALVNAGKNELNPPKPEPQPEPVPTPPAELVEVQPIPVEQSPYWNAPPAQVQSAADPTGETSHGSATQDHSMSGVESGASPSNAVASEAPAVAPSDPTASSTAGDGASQGSVHPTDAAPPASVSGSETQTSTARYVGKRYYDHPVYVTLADWLAGGGTEYDFNWRPNAEQRSY